MNWIFVRISARCAATGIPMSGVPMKPRFLFVLSLSCLLVVAPSSAKQRRATTKQPVKQEQPAAQPALPPPTLAQMPSTPPQVSFQGGQLTISAQNSTLGDILKAVRVQTGATIDLPGNAPERVVGNFGPAPARDVLASLLNGSHFNYLLLGSETDPSALDRVILMAKSSSTAVSDAQPQNAMEQASAYNQNYARPMAPVPAPAGNTVVVEGQDGEDDTSADDSTDAADDAQADDQTDQPDDQQAADDQQTQQQPDGQQTVKTPEQLLQELQQRQQQMQQQGIQPGMPPGMQPGMPRSFPNPGMIPNQPGVNTPPN
jgi:hypothetical protein